MRFPSLFRSVLNPGVARRETWAWALFDFANSGYTTVVVTTVFNAYFVAVVAGNAPWATLAWSGALAVSYLAIMATAPAMGAYADLHLAKKRLLALTTLGCAGGTAALGLAGPGEIGLAVVLVVVSNFCFGTGENLIAAFLPELVRGRGMGRLSGLGWGVGYFGGLFTLGLCLAYVAHAQERGLGEEVFVPVALLITAGVFLVASLPTFLFLRERGGGGGQIASASSGDAGALAVVYRRTLDTLGHVRGFPDLFRFLGCLVAYQSGVQAVIVLAAIYARQALDFDAGQTIRLVMVVNVMAALGALGFGLVQDRIGHRRALAMTLLGWLGCVLLLWRATGGPGFWLGAGVAGCCLGASQSAGRALVGYLSPPARRAEFFGLWGLAVKLSAILGPVCYGLASWLSHGDHRLAMLTLVPFFLLGLLLLAGVDPLRGRRRALRRDVGTSAEASPT